LQEKNTLPIPTILLDVMMPRLDGYAVCRTLRQRGKQTAVMMLTAKGMADDRVEGLDCGADDHLVTLRGEGYRLEL
jgi:DNA-binding response OmpR family regulator